MAALVNCVLFTFVTPQACLPRRKFGDSVPKDFAKYWGWAQDLSWSVIKANNAAIGYAAGQSAVAGSFWWSVAITYVFCTILHYLEG